MLDVNYNMVWYVYILECSDHIFYVGLTTNLKRRLWQHNQGLFKSSFTKGRLPVRLVYWEKFFDKHKAALREKVIKDWRREKKLLLISKFTSNSPKADEKGL